MQILIGWTLLILGGVLYVAQFISSINFKLAQHIGIQENPADTDPVLQRSERYTAYWDMVTLGWLPLAGFLMIVDHPWWPILSLIGGAIYFDTAGREAAKILSLKHEGVRMGSVGQQKAFFASYIAMAVLAVVLISYTVNAILSNY